MGEMKEIFDRANNSQDGSGTPSNFREARTFLGRAFDAVVPPVIQQYLFPEVQAVREIDERERETQNPSVDDPSPPRL